jgi:hypothetical protein
VRPRPALHRHHRDGHRRPFLNQVLGFITGSGFDGLSDLDDASTDLDGTPTVRFEARYLAVVTPRR